MIRYTFQADCAGFRMDAPHTPDRLLEAAVAACLWKDKLRNEKLGLLNYPLDDQTLFTVVLSADRILIVCSKDAIEAMEKMAKDCYILQKLKVPYEVRGA